MKLNVDCVRDVLLVLEDASYQEEVLLGKLISKLQEDYSYEEICYTVLKLDEAGYISANFKCSSGTKSITSISDITFDGHQFLADIRSNKLWNAVKEAAVIVGTDSLTSLAQIALKVASKAISTHIFN